MEHLAYDLGRITFDGFFRTIDEVYIMVEINYAVNVMLVDKDNYSKYCQDESYSYYGGYADKSPITLKIPYDGHWYLVIDNCGDDMEGIEATVKKHIHYRH